jgi:transcriptional/translational regulatory protein YebC/TACO1
VVGYAIDAEGADVFAAYADLEALQDGLRRRGASSGLSVAGWEHRWIVLTPCRIEDPVALRNGLRLLDALEELEDVRSVSSNLEADDELVEGLIDTA